MKWYEFAVRFRSKRENAVFWSVDRAIAKNESIAILAIKQRNEPAYACLKFVFLETRDIEVR